MGLGKTVCFSWDNFECFFTVFDSILEWWEHVPVWLRYEASLQTSMEMLRRASRFLQVNIAGYELISQQKFYLWMDGSGTAFASTVFVCASGWGEIDTVCFWEITPDFELVGWHPPTRVTAPQGSYWVLVRNIASGMIPSIMLRYFRVLTYCSTWL